MKFSKKRNRYEASNVWFRPADCTAYSYDWWAFVKKINGYIVFNTFNYSNSTCKHQNKVRDLMNKLDIKPDFCIEVPSGLQDLNWFNSAIKYYQDKINTLQTQINRPKSRRAANIKRMELINMHYICISNIYKINKQFPINSLQEYFNL